MNINYVKQISVSMEFGYESTNIYLLQSANENWLIDAGEKYDDNFDVLTSELSEFGINCQDLDGVLITHLHPDHVGLSFKLLERNPELPIFIPEGPSYEKRTKERIRLWLNRTGIPEEFHQKFVNKLTDFPYIEFMKRLKDQFETVEPGDSIQLGNYECSVIGARGHTPNQVVYYLNQDKVLFSGDHILLEETPNVSLFPEYLGGNPLADFHNSLETLLDRAVDMVFPGHGKPFRNGHQRIKELLNHHDERLNHCLEALTDEPQSALTVAEYIPWSGGGFDELDETHRYLALGETLAHLIELVERNQISCEENSQVYYFSRF